jgi:glycosyltransferase involved in cell wall biosynthesis
LFVSEKLSWPRQAGHDVHTYYLMQALSQLGHDVHLATVREQDLRAIEGAELASVHRLTGEQFRDVAEPPSLSKMQEKFRNYWGVRAEIIREIGSHAKEIQADAVVVVGLHVLPYLGAVQGALRIWYAGDEWVWHHWSQVRLLRPSTWGEMKQALVKGLYERAYRSILDRVWMVSDADRRAWRWVTGKNNVEVLPNGIDCDHYQPGDEPQEERSCVFWGRLDFGPNIQALQWFCRKVWPRVRRKAPDASFRIYGFQPTPAVQALAQPNNGVEIIPNLPDLRSAVRKHPVVVLPFVSGGGIKNKLLEAAAMGKAIVCTPRTVHGLNPGESLVQHNSAAGYAKALLELWSDGQRRAKLGALARAWVLAEHTWESAARKASEAIARACNAPVVSENSI